jgi:hypothetical protein
MGTVQVSATLPRDVRARLKAVLALREETFTGWLHQIKARHNILYISAE